MRKLAAPCFITLEGIEGSGKTSQIANITEFFGQRGIPIQATREPGGTEIADRIRRLLVEPHTEPLEPMAELLLYSAARNQHVARVIQPALAAGQIVLCDRFTDSTIAYQHYGRGIDLGTVTQVNAWATDGLSPDLTVYLDCDPEIGLERSKDRLDKADSPETRFEAESLEFHNRVRTGFLELARHQKDRIVVIDAAAEPATVAAQIQAELAKRFGLDA